MKIRRIGFTEGTLLFIRWLKESSNIILTEKEITELNKSEVSMLSWLHSTSGFYNKNIQINSGKVNIDSYDYKYLNNYLDIISKSFMNADILYICIHNFSEKISEYKEIFKNYFNPKNYHCIFDHIIYKFMNNERLVIVSPFANLMKSQYESGNVYKINKNFPIIKNIIFYTSPYTFFNDGPHNNSMETCKKVCDDIEEFKNDFDAIIIQFGSYSNLIAEYFDKLNKKTLSIGRDLERLFGVLKSESQLDNKQYYITKIPDEYKPDNFKLIEGGCYW